MMKAAVCAALGLVSGVAWFDFHSAAVALPALAFCVGAV